MLRIRRVCQFKLFLLSYRICNSKCNCIYICSCSWICICMVNVFWTVFRSHSVFTFIYLLFIRTVVAKFTMNFSYPSHTHKHTHKLVRTHTQRHRIRETVGNRRPSPSCGFLATTLRHSSLLSLPLPSCLGQVSSWRASFSLPGNSWLLPHTVLGVVLDPRHTTVPPFLLLLLSATGAVAFNWQLAGIKCLKCRKLENF